MIDIKYSKAILNLLFGKDSTGTGMSKEAELKYFQSKGVELMVTSKTMLDNVILIDDNSDAIIAKTAFAKKISDWKEIIKDSIFWTTMSLKEETKKHQYEDMYGETQTQEVRAAGWKIVERDNAPSQLSYPKTRYLALFTVMPDADGKNFKEPFYDINAVPTTYLRVDLDRGYFSRTHIMSTPNHDKENGGASTNNLEAIYYPEIVGVDWATSDNPLVGFGIFENQIPKDGEIPYLWGTLSNAEIVTAKVDHIPLFRTGEFQLSIS